MPARLILLQRIGAAALGGIHPADPVERLGFVAALAQRTHDCQRRCELVQRFSYCPGQDNRADIVERRALAAAVAHFTLHRLRGRELRHGIRITLQVAIHKPQVVERSRFTGAIPTPR